MTFLTVLAALFIERVLAEHRPRRAHRWFDRYCRWLPRLPLLHRLTAHPWGAGLVILPPLLLIAWLQVLFNGLGWPFALAFGTAVLLYSLGPADLGDDAEAFVAARDAGTEAQARACAEALCRGEVDQHEPQRSYGVARAVVVLAARRLIGPLFWFIAFGAVGAAAYRAIHLLAERLDNDECPQAMRRGSDEMRHIADWAPARITAAGYAIAGNFDTVAHAWRTFDYVPDDGSLTEAEQLLAQTGLAALETYPEYADDFTGEGLGYTDPMLIPPVVEDALALVWRSLAMWVAVVGGGSLVAALA